MCRCGNLRCSVQLWCIVCMTLKASAYVVWLWSAVVSDMWFESANICRIASYFQVKWFLDSVKLVQFRTSIRTIHPGYMKAWSHVSSSMPFQIFFSVQGYLVLAGHLSDSELMSMYPVHYPVYISIYCQCQTGTQICSFLRRIILTHNIGQLVSMWRPCWCPEPS